MKQHEEIKNVKIYDDVSLDDLNGLLQQQVITMKEFYQIMEEGKFENDHIKIYKKKTFKR